MDRRIDALAEQIGDELVDDEGRPADRDHVSDVVHAVAEDLADARVQDFVPLLVENGARGILRAEGLRRALPDEPAGPVRDAEDRPDAGGVAIARP
jgi:hypothetical protein